MNKSSFYEQVHFLRGVAVVLVLLNHFYGSIFNAGYIGVDAFFVISGFVITNSLLRSSQASRISDEISSFFRRRVARILPPLVVFVVITSILSIFTLPVNGPSIKTGLASLLGVSNIYLFLQSQDYFGFSSKINLFTNTWSLGVEEQFYLIFPFIYLGSMRILPYKHRSSLPFAWIILCIIFFVVSLHNYFGLLSSFYYLPYSRAWEFMPGVALASYSYQRKVNRDLILGRYIIFFLLIGLSTGIFSSVFINCSLAVILTLLFLIFSEQGAAENLMGGGAILLTKSIYFFGSISYSLYLWHWPVAVIRNIYIPEEYTNYSGLAGIAISIVFALLSYYLLEKNLYSYILGKKQLLRKSLTVLILAATSAIVSWSIARSRTLPTLYKKQSIANVSVASTIGCMGKDPAEKCLHSRNSGVRIFGLGDSHLVGLAPSITKALIGTNKSYSYWGGVVFVRDIFTKECKRDNCLKDIANLIDILEKNEFGNGDIILFHISRNRMYINSKNVDKEIGSLEQFPGFSRKGLENKRGLVLLAQAPGTG